MDSEKETMEESRNHEEEKIAAEVEEKSVVKEDAVEVGAENLGEKEENGDKEEVNEKGVEMEEEKGEGKGNVAEEEEVNDEEQGKGGEEEGSGEEGEDKGEGKEEGSGDEGEDKGEGKEELKAEKISSKKGSRTGKSKSEKAELSSPRTPGIERPTRERKTVDRFVVNATARGSATKLVAIEKGQGTQLKDIPNVAFKLSKRKADENLQLLHTILFGKKAKVKTLKKNIGLFSGFVWIENEEKQRAKVKDRLDKCVKEKLLGFCDVLNIPVSKATVKKEELSVKLLEFLEAPYATTDILLAEKDKSKKRKSRNSASKSSVDMASGKSKKKPKLNSESGKKRKHSSEERDDDKSEHSQSEDDQDDDDIVSGADSDKETTNSEEESEEQDEPEKQMIPEKSSSKTSTKKDSGSRIDNKSKAAKEPDTPGNSTKTSSSLKSKKFVSEAESKSDVRTPPTKKRNVDKQREETSTPPKDASSSKKKASKSSTEVVEKDQGKNESSKNAKKQPTKEEMHVVVTNILKEVDFNTATLSDILKQLGNHFGIDLIHRKSEIKEIITEVINNMSDDEDEEAAESGDSLGKESKDDEA